MARRRKDSFMSGRRHGGSVASSFLRKVLLWGLAALAVLVLAGFLGYAQLLSWLQSESFRDSLEGVLSNKAQATSAKIDGTLSLSANRVSLKGLSLQRPALPQGLEARNLHAEVVRSALLDRELHLTRLMVEEGALTLNLDHKKAAPAPTSTRKSGSTGKGKGKSSAKKEEGKASSSFAAGFAPTHVRLDKLDCKDFHASLRLSDKEYTLADCALSATPLARNKGKQAWDVRLSNGRLHTPLPIIGDCSLKTATLTLDDQHLTLSDTRLMLSPGELIVKAAREQSNGKWSAHIRANSVDIARLIGEDWKKRLTGSIIGRMQVEGNASGLQQAEGELSLQQAVLEGLPFLSNLPVGNSYPYRSLRLEKATAHLSYPHADTARNIHRAWLLDNIDLRAQGGWLLVRGHALVDDDGALAGTLLIGLPENIATLHAPVDSSLFRNLFNAEGESGFLWLRLNLSGTLSDPQEDLSVRLSTLISSALPEAAQVLRGLLLPNATPAEGAPAATPATPEATEAPRKLLEDAGKAAGELINTGLRALF